MEQKMRRLLIQTYNYEMKIKKQQQQQHQQQKPFFTIMRFVEIFYNMLFLPFLKRMNERRNSVVSFQVIYFLHLQVVYLTLICLHVPFYTFNFYQKEKKEKKKVVSLF